MSAPLNLRVFLSSPGDVAEERKLARHVMQELEGSHLLRGRVRFEILAWDDENAAAPMDAGKIPQESVNAYVGRPADCDLTRVILWSRIGSLQPPQLTRPDGSRYESGTVWEQEDAIHARKPVFIDRRTEKPQVEIDDPEFDRKRTQYSSVKSFFDRFANPDGSPQAGFNSYAQPPEFARMLRQHLEGFVNERLGGISASPPVSPDDPKVSQILTLIDEITRKNQQLDEKQAQIIQLQQENEHLRRSAIARTLTAAAQPTASAAVLEASEALEAGDPRPAEALLREEERVKVETISLGTPDESEARREAADLAREQGALAFGYDARAALAAYSRAADYDPEDVWTRFKIGDLEVRLGDSSDALESYRRALHIVEAKAERDPESTVWQRDLSVSHIKIGDVLLAQGDGAAALSAYRKSLSITEALAARDPSDTDWQRDISVSHNKVGAVLMAQGDGTAALATFRKSLAIVEALAAKEPTNTDWQRDISVGHNKIGDVLLAQGDRAAALVAYRKALAIAEALAASDPANTEWQRDVSVSHNKIGDVLVGQGEMAVALATYRKGLAIRETLIARDPANTGWQRDLSVSHERIGDVMAAQGDRTLALAAFRKTLEIREVLVARDPANTDWQRDLSVSHLKIGDELVHQTEKAAALAAYRRGLVIAEALAPRDPSNTDWQRNLSVSHTKIGEVLLSQGENSAALAAFRKGLAIREELVALDPTNTEWQRDVFVSRNKIGDSMLAQKDEAAALDAYHQSAVIAEALVARDPSNTLWQTDLVVSCSKLGTVEHGQDVDTRRDYLTRGKSILVELKSQGRLAPAQDWTDWFDEQLRLLQRPAKASRRNTAPKASAGSAKRKSKRKKN